MQRAFTFLLTLCVLCAIPLARAEVDYESDYETALILAMNDLTNIRGLETSVDMLQQLGGYRFANNYVLYLQMVMDAQTDHADFAMLSGRMENLGAADAFAADLAERRFPSCEELMAYIDARQMETDGNTEGALVAYSRISVLDAAVRADDLYIQRAQCGEHARWSFRDGTLTVSGTGAMYNYSACRTPWYGLRNDIMSIVINQGITAVGENAFLNCNQAVHVTLPDTLTEIKGSAFESCTLLSEVVLPYSLTTIEGWAFGKCISLMSVRFRGASPDADPIEVEINQNAFCESGDVTILLL